MSISSLGMKAGRPSSTKQGMKLSDLIDKNQKVRVNFDLDRETHTRLKIYAAKAGKSITDILRELIDTLE